MNNSQRLLEREIYDFLSDFKLSLERSYRILSGESEYYDGGLLNIILDIEKIRLNFNNYRRGLSAKRGGFLKARVEVLSGLERVILSGNNKIILENVPFRARFTFSESRNENYFFYQIVNNEENKSALYYLVSFIKYMDGNKLNKNSDQESFDFRNVKNITPPQQIAPVQFKIVDNKIVVSKVPPIVRSEDKENISSALDYIKKFGESLIDSLRNSNCDRRLVEVVSDLHSQINDRESIVKIGLANLACSNMCAQFQNELPDVIVSNFNTYSGSVSMYVGQFPEWEQFTRNALQSNFSDDDIKSVDETSAELEKFLSSNPHIADQEVPKTLTFIRGFLSNPGVSSKRAAFAMIRTIENLISAIIYFSSDLINETAEKTRKKISSAGSTLIVTLLGVVIIGASGVGSAAMHAGSPWVNKVVEIVERQIEKLKQ